MRNRWIAGVLAFAAFTGMMTGCSKTAANNTSETAAAGAQRDAGSQGDAATESASDSNTFIITLYPEDAPITCENFEKLVQEGFYDGLNFHRVVTNFMAQGGDGAPAGKTAESIKGEFANNGVDNPRKHVRGTVSMARTTVPDSASSQFFICYTECDYLDGSYAAFGEVTEGMEVVDQFLTVERVMGSDGDISSPTKPIIMEKAEMIEDDADGHPRVQITMNDFLK